MLRTRKLDMEMTPDTLKAVEVNELFVAVAVDSSVTTEQAAFASLGTHRAISSNSNTDSISSILSVNSGAVSLIVLKRGSNIAPIHRILCIGKKSTVVPQTFPVHSLMMQHFACTTSSLSVLLSSSEPLSSPSAAASASSLQYPGLFALSIAFPSSSLLPDCQAFRFLSSATVRKFGLGPRVHTDSQ